MSSLTKSRAYWDEVAENAEFTHPVNEAWIAQLGTVSDTKSRAVLDYGCGYGRMLGVLKKLGYTCLCGVDPSGKMIERAKIELPEATFETIAPISAIAGTGTSFEAESFSLVMLVAVLTCVPDSAEQHAIISEILRVLAPGGYLYLSDYLLQTNERNVDRYRRSVVSGHPYGVFEIDDGATSMRHHERAYLHNLLVNFDLVKERSFSLLTMKGNPATGIQLLLRKRVELGG